MIEMYRVSKRYPNGVDALTDVTCSVQAGEFCFLSGPSGAGKSTFVRLLMCMETVTDGQILVKGRNLRMLHKRSIPYLRRNIGVIFQNFRLLDNRSVFDNVAIALEIQGIPRREIVPRVEQTLDLVGLSDHHLAYPQMMSGGEQQRVAIARALVNEPALLLADEPTGNLDPSLSMEIMSLLMDIHRKGTTVIVATHDTALMERFPGRMLTLNDGFLVSDTGASAEASATPPADPALDGAPDPMDAEPLDEPEGQAFGDEDETVIRPHDAGALPPAQDESHHEEHALRHNKGGGKGRKKKRKKR